MIRFKKRILFVFAAFIIAACGTKQTTAPAEDVEAILQHIKALDKFNSLESCNIETAKTDMLAGEDTSKFNY